ncbi:MAG TPA: ApaG domain-containing protein [Opitutaceae bacterium]|nr:ApaG domain-containing protein [Opitutaceae bacterium]
MSASSLELPGLTAHLDRLVYHNAGAAIPAEKRHVFVYFITLRNGSDRTVTLVGRKWVIENEDGTRLVVEGDKIVGETPRLEPGEQFSYNSCHLSACKARVWGSFHGADEEGTKVHVLLEPFDLVVPS